MKTYIKHITTYIKHIKTYIQQIKTYIKPIKTYIQPIKTYMFCYVLLCFAMLFPVYSPDGEVGREDGSPSRVHPQHP